jgi:hypothetical protein
MDKHCEKHGSDSESASGFWAGWMSTERRKEMDLFNFIVWLTAGAVIGWFANRMVSAQHRRRADKPALSEEGSSEKG